jgi:hypothetical protein
MEDYGYMIHTIQTAVLNSTSLYIVPIVKKSIPRASKTEISQNDAPKHVLQLIFIWSELVPNGVSFYIFVSAIMNNCRTK